MKTEYQTSANVLPCEINLYPIFIAIRHISSDIKSWPINFKVVGATEIRHWWGDVENLPIVVSVRINVLPNTTGGCIKGFCKITMYRIQQQQECCQKYANFARHCVLELVEMGFVSNFYPLATANYHTRNYRNSCSGELFSTTFS